MEGGNQTQSETIRRKSDAIRDNQTPSEAIRGHQRPSDAIRGHERPSEAIKGHQRPSKAIKGHQRQSETDPVAFLGREWEDAIAQRRHAQILNPELPLHATRAVALVAQIDLVPVGRAANRSDAT